MTDGEKEFFIEKVANDYFAYLTKYPKSMIARIYGIYTVQIEGVSPVNLILMAHTITIQPQNDI